MNSMNVADSWTAEQQQIVRVSAAEKIFQSLRSAIESGDLPVGQKLSPETALAKQYGVSRSVIREALRSCAALGLTETRTGRGTFIISTTPASDPQFAEYSARSLMEARPFVEVPAARYAALRITPLLRDELFAILDQMAREENEQKWVRLDNAFHETVARASGNKVFERFVADIREALARQSEMLSVVAGRQHASNVEHRRIVEAIVAGDEGSAGRAMTEHLSAVSEALEKIVQKKAAAVHP